MAGRTAVGIVVDVGTVQAVELAADGDRLLLRRAVADRLPPEAFADGELIDANVVAEAVRALIRTHRLPRRNVCVALGGRLAIARVIEAPGTSGTEVEQLLQDRIARYAIYDDREVLWKASPLETESSEKRAYLSAAVAKSQVSMLLPALRRAGVRVSHVEPYALTVVRSLVACVGADESPVILVTVRNEATDFVIVKGGQPLLVRSVEQGSLELGRSPEAIEDLLTEAKRSVDFCRSRFADVQPRLWLGRASSEDSEVAAGLLACLKQDMDGADVAGLPAWPALAAGGTMAEGSRHYWAAVGAAMVGLPLEKAVPHLNLVPADWPEIERVEKQLRGVVVSVGLALLATGVVTMMIRLATTDTASQARAASVQVDANTTNVKTAAQLKRQVADAASRAGLWQDVRAGVRPFDWTAGLEAIMGQIPEGVRVQQILYRRKTLRIVGEAELTDLVHQVVRRLNRLPQLEEANIERLAADRSAKSPLATYIITCRFREQRAGSAQEAK